MITMFVTLILITTMLGVVGWSVFTFQRSAEMTAMATRNVARMDGVAALIRASVKYNPVTRAYEAPLDDAWTPESTSRTLVPRQVVGDDHTPWGGQYAFCPVSTYAGAGAIIRGGVNASDQYQVSTQQIPDQGNLLHTYVTGMTWSGMPAGIPADVVGFVLSPAPMSTVQPNCSDVRLQKGYYVVDGSTIQGTVSVVSSAGIILTQSLAQSSTPVIYVAPVAGGSGNGADAGNPMALGNSTQSALSYWEQNLPAGITFILAAGSYQLTEADADIAFGPNSGVPASDVSPARSFVYFKGPTAGTATLAGVGGAATDLYLGVNTQIDGNVNIDPMLKVHVLPFTQVSLKGVGTVGSLSVDGGSASVTASTVGTASISAGSLTLATGSLGAYGAFGGQTALDFTTATSAVALSAMTVAGGQTSITTSAAVPEPVSVANALFSGGRLDLDGTALTFAFLSGGASPFKANWGPGFAVSLYNNGAVPSALYFYSSGVMSGPFNSSKTLLDGLATVAVTSPTVSSSCFDLPGTVGESSCEVVCDSTAYPYFVYGECAGQNAVLVSSKSASASEGAGWSCQWRPDMGYSTVGNVLVGTVTSLPVTGGATVNSPSPLGNASMTTTAHCSAVPH
jgi:hypothetical protein